MLGILHERVIENEENNTHPWKMACPSFDQSADVGTGPCNLWAEGVLVLLQLVGSSDSYAEASPSSEPGSGLRCDSEDRFCSAGSSQFSEPQELRL